MKIRELFRASLYLVLIFLISGCNMPIFTSPQPTLDRDQISTAAAQTIEVTFTLGALQENLNKPTLTVTPSPQPIAPSATTTVITPVFTSTLLPIPTNTPLYPMIHSTINTNCRTGPSSDYDVVGYLMVGDKVGVIGRNANSTWWVIQNPDNLSKNCWVWNQTTIVEGNLSNIPVTTPVPTVTPAIAKITITSNAVPVNYSGPCPVDIELTAKIATTLPATVKYSWLSSFSYPFSADEFIFDVAGSQKFSETMTITSDTTGFVRFRITLPYPLKGERIDIAVNCT